MRQSRSRFHSRACVSVSRPEAIRLLTFQQDVRDMVSNARQYNDATSLIVQDATAIEASLAHLAAIVATVDISLRLGRHTQGTKRSKMTISVMVMKNLAFIATVCVRLTGLCLNSLINPSMR